MNHIDADQSQCAEYRDDNPWSQPPGKTDGGRKQTREGDITTAQYGVLPAGRVCLYDLLFAAFQVQVPVSIVPGDDQRRQGIYLR